MNDKSEMPFGKYKGVKLEDVPDEYLLWLYNDGEMETHTTKRKELFDYIVDNLDAIKLNVEQNQTPPEEMW